ncbi:MAG: Aminodeoxyfutalosine nucleosidase [Candidatus Izimaplasma bacterium HR2]|nr:MAG: Aminodeoxyfutalosine nucleosidase [Candidatus Izimaplasma bacterium HR2]
MENNIPIIETRGLDEKGIITAEMLLSEYEKLPKHITVAVMLFDKSPSEKILKHCKLLFNFVGASFIIPQYIYKDSIVVSYAPLGSAAAAGLLEELLTFGIKKVIACGSSGLVGDFDPSNFLLVNKAIRDEGLSYHYLEPSTYVETSEELNNLISIELDKMNLKYQEGITWTTDAFYRETKTRVEIRKKEGAIAVEMECAGLAAVAKYRNIQFSQLLYFSDIVKQDAWSGFLEERPNIKQKINEVVISIAQKI